jgi:hypothetical protein
VLKQAECTLYHCIWCCASVSAFPQEIWKNGFDCEQQRETESERERMNGGGSERYENLFVHIFWRLPFAFAPGSEEQYECCFRL